MRGARYRCVIGVFREYHFLLDEQRSTAVLLTTLVTLKIEPLLGSPSFARKRQGSESELEQQIPSVRGSSLP